MSGSDLLLFDWFVFAKEQHGAISISDAASFFGEIIVRYSWSCDGMLCFAIE